MHDFFLTNIGLKCLWVYAFNAMVGISLRVESAFGLSMIFGLPIFCLVDVCSARSLG